MEKEIWGQERVLSSLRGAIRQGHVSHAYLFLGSAGMGKKTIADYFAKTLQCEAGGEEPCGHCKSCMAFSSGNHPDVIYVRPEKKTLGVEDIRSQIGETVDLKQYRYRYKIYIVEDADLMTVQAQNAFLKTLEEPPAQVVFLLLAQRESVFLPTILSRVVRMKLQPLSDAEVARYLLENTALAQQEAAIYASYAQGSIGRALELMEDTSFQQMRQEVLEKLAALPAVSLAEALQYAKEWEKYKNEPRFLDIIYLWYRDILAAKLLMEENSLIQKDQRNQIFQAAGRMCAAEAAKKASAVWEAKKSLVQNGNFRLTLEVMLMKLKGEQI